MAEDVPAPFAGRGAQELSRVGVVDVGSNSVRLVVFDGAARSPAYFFNEKVMAGLGKGLSETGRLDPTGRRRALSALRRFAALSDVMETGTLTAVATAAVREAADGAGFCEEVRRDSGIALDVIDGAEEARLSAQGVLLGWPQAEGLVCDIGGSSMEVAEVGGGRVGRRLSTPLGPLKLRDIAGGAAARRARIEAEVGHIAETAGSGPARLYLVGGSWRAIARLDMERRGYPLLVLHEYRMTPERLAATLDWIAASEPAELRARVGISAERMALVPQAGEVLAALLARLGPREIHVSSYGIREGLLYERMPEPVRRQDPLIEACRASEAQSARMPGAGRRLFDFLEPLFRNASTARRRLAHAACLLHDTSWRTHPDYRAEVCFDNATRANLGGLDHEGRIYLAVALLHRYKNARAERFAPLVSLLDEADAREAKMLGQAMRFGAMLASGTPDRHARLVWDRDDARLDLVLAPGAEVLFGEAARARFTALAKTLGATERVHAEATLGRH